MFKRIKEFFNPEIKYNPVVVNEDQVPDAYPTEKIDYSKPPYYGYRFCNFGTISELVLNFVDEVKNNPKKFKVEYCGYKDTANKNFMQIWAITDLKNKNKLYLNEMCNDETSYEGGSNTKFLTKGEAKYIFYEIRNLYEKRKRKFEEIKTLRSFRKIKSLYGEQQ